MKASASAGVSAASASMKERGKVGLNNSASKQGRKLKAEKAKAEKTMQQLIERAKKAERHGELVRAADFAPRSPRCYEQVCPL